jgi:uncharacterized protein YggE
MRVSAKLLSLLCLVGLLSWIAGAAESRDDKEKKERTLTVQGQGKVQAIPDIATLSVEVSQDGSDLDPVLTQVRKQMNKVLETVKSQGIQDKDVRTDLFQVRPKYEHDKRGNPRRVGYVVTNRISVKVRDLKKAGRVLGAVLDAGATTVNGPDFEIDNPEAIERQALAAATKDAKARAATVAEAAGVQLGEILTINPQSITWPGPRRPYLMRAMAMESAAPAEEPIAAGEQTITGFVTLTYIIR